MLSNTRAGYGWAAIALHWISAIGILWLLWQGRGIEGAAGQNAHMAAVLLHNSIGAVFFTFIAARVISSATQMRPDALGANVWLNRLSVFVHVALLLNIVVLIVSGPLAAWSFGNPIGVFGWFAIPGPFAQRNMAVHNIAETIHGAAQYPLIALLVLHVLGALKHVVIDRDGTVMRMLWPRTAA